jgi:hypothetical protein
MIQQVRDIEKVSAEWNLTKEQRIELYFECAGALSREQDHSNAFLVYFQAFKVINNQKGDYKIQAEQLILSAFKSSQTINLEGTLVFDAVKDLKTTSQQLHNLFNLIVSSDIHNRVQP